MAEVVKRFYENLKKENIPFSHFSADYRLPNLHDEAKVKKDVKLQGGKIKEEYGLIEIRDVEKVKDAVTLTLPIKITKASVEIGRKPNTGCLAIDPLNKRYEADIGEYYLDKIRFIMKKLGLREGNVLSKE